MTQSPSIRHTLSLLVRNEIRHLMVPSVWATIPDITRSSIVKLAEYAATNRSNLRALIGVRQYAHDFAGIKHYCKCGKLGIHIAGMFNCCATCIKSPEMQRINDKIVRRSRSKAYRSFCTAKVLSVLHNPEGGARVRAKSVSRKNLRERIPVEHAAPKFSLDEFNVTE